MKNDNKEIKKEEVKDFRKKKKKGSDFKKDEPNKISRNICDTHEDGA